MDYQNIGHFKRFLAMIGQSQLYKCERKNEDYNK